MALQAGVEPRQNYADDIALHIPQNIMEQIWRGDYINLAILLKGPVELSELSRGQSLHVMPNGQIESRHKELRGKITSIERWTDAFMIFMSVCLRKDPTLAQDLIKYMWVIRDAAAKFKKFDWQTYDEQFRLRQAHLCLGR